MKTESPFFAGLQEAQIRLTHSAEALQVLTALLSDCSGHVPLSSTGLWCLLASVECDARAALDELNVALSAKH